MYVKVHRISVDEHNIDSNLNLDVEVFYKTFESVNSLSALVKIGSKAICLMHEIGNSYFEAFPISNDIDTSSKDNSKKRSFRLMGYLSKQAIDLIEDQRNKTPDRSILFQIDFAINGFSFEPRHGNPSIGIVNENSHDQVRVEQSDWVNNFSSKLGIGKYLLLELPIEDGITVPKLWKKLLPALRKNLFDAERSLKTGEWGTCMFHMRKFYENSKIGDSKPGNAAFKNAFSKLLKEDQHSEVGIGNLYDALWKFFEFNSKFVHDRDQQGNVVPTAIANKEDAYLAYTLGVGLLNFFSKKLGRYVS